MLNRLSANRIAPCLLGLAVLTLLGCDQQGFTIPDWGVDVSEAEVVSTDQPKVQVEFFDTQVAPHPTQNWHSSQVDAPTDFWQLSLPEQVALNHLNQQRVHCGFGALRFDAELTLAARNHANYLMYMQMFSEAGFQGHHQWEVDAYSGSENPYYTGFDLADRLKITAQRGVFAAPVDYDAQIAVENLSYVQFNDAYFNNTSDEAVALTSMQGLLAAPYHMASLISPSFQEVGIHYTRARIKASLQLSDGSIQPAQAGLLELVSATPTSSPLLVPTAVMSFPCQGSTQTAFELRNETPDPFAGSGRDLAVEPIGQPIFILAPTALEVESYQMHDDVGNLIALQALTHRNDPHQLLPNTQVILMPLSPLEPNSRYHVSYQPRVDGQLLPVKRFTFSTKAVD